MPPAGADAGPRMAKGNLLAHRAPAYLKAIISSCRSHGRGAGNSACSPATIQPIAVTPPYSTRDEHFRPRRDGQRLACRRQYGVILDQIWPRPGFAGRRGRLKISVYSTIIVFVLRGRSARNPTLQSALHRSPPAFISRVGGFIELYLWGDGKQRDSAVAGKV